MSVAHTYAESKHDNAHDRMIESNWISLKARHLPEFDGRNNKKNEFD